MTSRSITYLFMIAAVAVLASGCDFLSNNSRADSAATVDSLRRVLLLREAEIALLRQTIAESSDTTSSDSARVESPLADSLPLDVTLKAQSANQPELLLLGSAYYIIGRRAELLHKKVVGRSFPLVGRLKILPARRLDDTFHRVATDAPVTFAINHPGARLLSSHPSGSYSVTTSKGELFWRELHVTNPELFWSETKVMVIVYD
ncbi:MAG: hypothetical protein SOZ00_08295 [Tidjanibacter sp.]|nr:hypothetical protein [Tidjanibacter sp.]